MGTWLQKIARAGAMAASNQFLGSNSMSSPKAGLGLAMPKGIGAPMLGAPSPGNGAMGTGGNAPIPGIIGQKDLAANTSGALAQQSFANGADQNKLNTAPVQPKVVHPAPSPL